MSNTELSYWQNQVAEWQRSNLSVAAYCWRHQVSYHKLLYWRRKLDESSSSEPAVNEVSGFTRVVSQRLDVSEYTSSQPALTVTLPNGIKVVGLYASNISLLGDILRLL